MTRPGATLQNGLDGPAISRTTSGGVLLPALESRVDRLAGQVLKTGEVDAEARIAEDFHHPLGRVIRLAARGADNRNCSCTGVFPGHTHNPLLSPPSMLVPE